MKYGNIISRGDMEDQTVITNLEGREMGTVVSHVPQLMAARKWSPMDLIRRGLSVQTAYRLAKGETNVNGNTIRRLCELFEVDSFDKVIEYIPDTK